MLSSIKDKTKGWVAYLIIALIAIPFALFGKKPVLTS
jgi:peptidyl-prolyl cis-trans isomerase D